MADEPSRPSRKNSGSRSGVTAAKMAQKKWPWIRGNGPGWIRTSARSVMSRMLYR